MSGWPDMAEFVDVIAISQGTLGPIAINSATYVGFKVAGVPGSAATLGGTPPFTIMMILGRLFLSTRKSRWWGYAEWIRPVVVAPILCAALSLHLLRMVPAIAAEPRHPCL